MYKTITFEYLAGGNWHEGKEVIEDNPELIKARVEELNSATMEFSGRHKYRNVNVV